MSTAKGSVHRRMTEQQSRQMLIALQRAVSYCDGWAGLAARIAAHTKEPISPQACFKWSVSSVPAERAVDIEGALDGAVLRQELRPDLYDGMRDAAA